MADPTEADRRVGVLKKALLSLTRQKQDLEEQVRILTEQFAKEQAEIDVMARDLRSEREASDALRQQLETARNELALAQARPGVLRNITGLFGRDQDGAGARPEPPAVSAEAAEDLLAQNQQLHVDAFELRQQLAAAEAQREAEQEGLRHRLVEAEAEVRTLRRESEGLQSTLVSEASALSEDNRQLRAQLRAFLDPLDAGGCEPDPAAPLFAAPLLAGSASPTTAARMEGAGAGAMTSLGAVLLLLPQIAVTALEQCQPGDVADRWASEPAVLRDHLVSVHRALHAATQRVRAAWRAHNHAGPDTAEALLAAIAALAVIVSDAAPWLWRALYLAVPSPHAPVTGRLSLGFVAAVKASALTTQRCCADVQRWAAAMRTAAATDRWEWPPSVVGAVRRLLVCLRELRTAGPDGGGSALQLAAAELTAALSDLVVGPDGEEVPSAPAGTLVAAAITRAVMPTAVFMSPAAAALEHAATLPQPAAPGPDKPAPMPCPPPGPASSPRAEPTVPDGRWLSAADEQCALWRSHFEMALAELDDRTLAHDAAVEEAARLREALREESHDKAWQVGALQEQVALLSDRLADVAAAGVNVLSPSAPPAAP